MAELEPIPRLEDRGGDIPLSRWDALREDYVSGGGSVEECAIRHGFPCIGHAKNKAVAEGWSRMRQDRQDRIKRELVAGPTPQPMASPQTLSPAWALEESGKALSDTIRYCEGLRRVADNLVGCEDKESIDKLVSIININAKIFGFGGAQSSRKQSAREARRARVIDPPATPPADK